MLEFPVPSGGINAVAKTESTLGDVLLSLVGI